MFNLLSCSHDQDSNEKGVDQNKVKPTLGREWKRLKCGLYINSIGDLAFATNPQIAFTPENELEAERCPNVFITEFGTYEDSTQLKEVVDTVTFEHLGANMYKDKNHLYSYYAMCDGGYFNIFSNDTAGFSYLGGVYFQFKSKIYHTRQGEIDADAESFVVYEDFGQIAKDKNGYFSFNERISEKQLRLDLGEELFNKLKSVE